MRIQPRRQVLDIWRSVVRSSYRDGCWQWGGRDKSNSISDAEQLLCLLYPATELTNLALDRPDEMAEDVSKALEPLGNTSRIPQRIIQAIAEYVERHTIDGEPVFGGGSYLRTDGDNGSAPTAPQLAMGMVDSYSLSVSVCLAALGFINVYRPNARKPAMQDTLSELHAALRKRLTSAMIGLLRSFVVNPLPPEDPARAVMLSMVNQTALPEQVMLKDLREALGRVRSRLLEDVRIGVDTEMGLDEEDRLFECGWGWGIVRNAAPIHIYLRAAGLDKPPRIADEPGVADPRPYLYSTVVALDGINDLRAQRTRELNLLDDEQRRLNDALQIRWDLTQRYWSTMARFGAATWPLEDIPWRTSDGEESDYYTLLVSAVLVQDLENRQATDDDLNRAVVVFESLAQRGRITRRVTVDDPAVAMHVPGVRMRLGGSAQIGPQLYWQVADFAPLLLKRALQAARLSANITARDRLLRIAESTMDHLVKRCIGLGPAAGLWDDPGPVFLPYTEHKPQESPSWYLTERVVEALVAAARTYEEPPLRGSAVLNIAQETLHEAEHLLNQVLLDADADDTSARRTELIGIEAMLGRARTIATDQPGTANALAVAALRSLDRLAEAQLDASRGA
jgi:hypothetical protein